MSTSQGSANGKNYLQNLDADILEDMAAYGMDFSKHKAKWFSFYNFIAIFILLSLSSSLFPTDTMNNPWNISHSFNCQYTHEEFFLWLRKLTYTTHQQIPVHLLQLLYLTLEECKLVHLFHLVFEQNKGIAILNFIITFLLSCKICWFWFG